MFRFPLILELFKFSAVLVARIGLHKFWGMRTLHIVTVHESHTTLAHMRMRMHIYIYIYIYMMWISVRAFLQWECIQPQLRVHMPSKVMHL